MLPCLHQDSWPMPLTLECTPLLSCPAISMHAAVLHTPSLSFPPTTTGLPVRPAHRGGRCPPPQLERNSGNAGHLPTSHTGCPPCFSTPFWGPPQPPPLSPGHCHCSGRRRPSVTSCGRVSVRCACVHCAHHCGHGRLHPGIPCEPAPHRLPQPPPRVLPRSVC